MMLFMLLAAHFLADYPLQGDFLAKGKNHLVPLVAGQLWWPHCLLAHAMIHGGFVALITGNVWLGIAEVVCHALIDYGKCDMRYGIHTDQAMHVGCKLVWAGLA